MKVEDMSPADRLKSVKGEASQGNYLVSAKERHSEKKNQRANYSNSKGRSTYAASSGKADRMITNFWEQSSSHNLDISYGISLAWEIVVRVA